MSVSKLYFQKSCNKLNSFLIIIITMRTEIIDYCLLAAL